MDSVTWKEILYADWCSLGPDTHSGYDIQDDETGQVLMCALSFEMAEWVLDQHAKFVGRPRGVDWAIAEPAGEEGSS